MTPNSSATIGAIEEMEPSQSERSIDRLCIDTIRTLSIDAVQRADSGHPGTPMALAPVMYTLWQRFLRFDPSDVTWPNRDRFVLSNGHASMLLYAMLHLTDAKDEGVIAGLNGGVYVNPDLSIVKSCTLDPALAKLAVNSMLGQGLDVWIYTEDEWLVRDRAAPHVAREEWIMKFDAKIAASFTDAHLARAVKIVGVSDDPVLLAAGEKAAQKSLGEKASVACSQAYYIDVTSAEANKGAVVTMLSRRMNIPPEQIATIGDMPTDVFMFRKSGFSIAMGNASDAVKAQASAVTGTNQNEGFANAMDKFVLHPVAA